MSAAYSWPSSAAVRAISSIGEPPSDQSECRCRSPRSAAAQLRRGLVQLGERPRRRRLQRGQVLRLLAGDRLLDDGGGPLADALDAAQAAGLGEQPDVVRRQGREGGRRRPERLHPVARLQRPLEQERDAAQVRDRIPGITHPP